MSLSIDKTTFKSPNYDRDTAGRPILMQPRGIVLHSGEGSRQSDLGWLCNPKSKASAHFYVCRDGTIYQLLPENYIAWHAGESLFAGIKDWNSLTLGVEMEHTKNVHRDYPPIQVEALRLLCRDLIARYRFQSGFIQSHRAVAAHRRTNLRFDPRDWPESTLRPWVANLYHPPILPLAAALPAPFLVQHSQAVFEARRPDASVALAGQAVVYAGDSVIIDQVMDGWGHLSNHLGFVPMGILERLS
jgi:hypothetical protein